VRRVPAVRLEQGDEVVERVRQAARVVQELPHGHAGHERRGVAVERERPFVNELEHGHRDEEFGHASDAGAVLRRHRCARLHVGDPGCFLPTEAGAGSHGDRAWEAALHRGLQVTSERRQGTAVHTAILGHPWASFPHSLG
jgi:hypothetical protein